MALSLFQLTNSSCDAYYLRYLVLSPCITTPGMNDSLCDIVSRKVTLCDEKLENKSGLLKERILNFHARRIVIATVPVSIRFKVLQYRSTWVVGKH